MTNLKLTTLPKPPGPSASESEVNAWYVRVYRAVTELTRAMMNLQGNAGAEVAGGIIGGGTGSDVGLSDALPKIVDPAVAGEAGLGVLASRADHRHPIIDLDLDYVRRDGTTTMDADLTFSVAGDGIVLVVNDGSFDRTYRMALAWNATTGRPMMDLVEVV